MKKILIMMVMLVVVLTGCSTTSYTNITASELDQYMVSNPGAIYIDVRTPEEFKADNIEGFTNVDSKVAGIRLQKLMEKMKNYFNL